MKRLETDRLILRHWRENDLTPMIAINQDPKVCDYFPEIGNRDTTIALIDRIIKHDEEHGFSLYAVEIKATHAMIGFLGLMTPSFEAHFTPAIEIGWRLSSQHWNQGFATEGAKAVLEHTFTDLNLNEVVSFTVVSNQASRRVMEKIGMQHHPNDNFDHPKLDVNSPLKRHVLYRLSKKDWLQEEE
jgi:RimJ/RimL family protein N-acetyltransferase